MTGSGRQVIRRNTTQAAIKTLQQMAASVTYAVAVSQAALSRLKEAQVSRIAALFRVSPAIHASQRSALRGQHGSCGMPLLRAVLATIPAPRAILGLGLCGFLMACGQAAEEFPVVGSGALGGFERAERGCVAQAERQGLFVEGVQFTQSRVQRGGRISGAETVLIVRDGTRTYPLRCQFTYRTGAVRLAPI